MSTDHVLPDATDSCPGHHMEQSGEASVAPRPNSPKVAACFDTGTAPLDGTASVPGTASEVSPEIAGPGRETAMSCAEGPGRTGTVRARPLRGRWPPATPARRRHPFDLDDPALARVRARPHPEQWDPDEPLGLFEAVALLFPGGPITVWTLRTARRQGQLGTATVAGRLYTSVGAVRAMTRPSPNPPGPPRDAGAARAPVDRPVQSVSSTRPGEA